MLRIVRSLTIQSAFCVQAHAARKQQIENSFFKAICASKARYKGGYRQEPAPLKEAPML
jgi:hypothetical protein